MSKREKLIASIVARPSEAKFSDVDAVLSIYGWRRFKTRGSHHSYIPPTGGPPLIVPVMSGRKVLRQYLDRVCQRLDLDDVE